MGVAMHVCIRVHTQAASQRELQGGPAAGRRLVHRPEILGEIQNLILKLQQRSVVGADLRRQKAEAEPNTESTLSIAAYVGMRSESEAQGERTRKREFN